MPKVSVVIPAYNAENYIGDAVSSVLSQTLRDLELIVIDDGSDDRTLLEIERVVDGDSRVRIVSRPNKGIVATPNEGIDLANSPWVAMLDADDVSRPDRLEKQLGLAKAKGLNLVGSQIDYLDGRQGTSHFPLDYTDIAHQLFVWKNPIANPSVMIDRHWLGEARYPKDKPHAQDYALWLQLVMREDARIGNHPEPLVGYRIHPEQNTKRNIEPLFASCEAALGEALQRLGLFNPRMMDFHARAFRGLPLEGGEKFLEYCQWLVQLRGALSGRFGSSREIFNYWRRLFPKLSTAQAYEWKMGAQLGAGLTQNIRYFLKYRG